MTKCCKYGERRRMEKKSNEERKKKRRAYLRIPEVSNERINGK